MGNINFALTKPQLEHAQCGSLALPHFGQATSTAGLRAWCERRLRLQHLDVFFTGTIPRTLTLGVVETAWSGTLHTEPHTRTLAVGRKSKHHRNGAAFCQD